MLISSAYIITLLTLTVPALSTHSGTETTIAENHSCHKKCYKAYRSVIGDLSQDFVLSTPASHRDTAGIICSSRNSSACEFCDIGLGGRFPILSLQKVELNGAVNAGARMRVGDAEARTCADCQRYLDTCMWSDEREMAYRHPRDEDERPYPLPLHVTDHQRTLRCELSLCTAGPTHCGFNRTCKRQICKDLAARAGFLQPARILKCKDCVKSWVGCVHDRCIPPSLDTFADRLLSPNCFKENNTQCQQHSWQELNAAIAPDQGCVERCWSTTPTHCHSGTCALPFRLSASQNSTSLSLTSVQDRLETPSHGCNKFRNTCLKQCHLEWTYIDCREKCERLHGTIEKYREQCEKTCEKRTCWSECRDMTCCIGPEQCRKDGEAYRCSKKLQCEKFRNLAEGGAMPRN
jgi:hypothetical protein